jgi:hypothetical protein
MKKTFDMTGISNQLKGASAFFPYEDKKDTPPISSSPPQPVPSEPVIEVVAQPKATTETVQPSDTSSVGQSVGRSVNRPTSQLTVQSTEQSTHLPSTKIVGRPKAFYITERLNIRLDDAVKYLQEKHGIKKVDRSTVVNALLDNEENWSEASLDLLVSRVLSLLTSRLTS